MTLEELETKYCPKGKKMEGLITISRLLGIGHWTVRRLLRDKKPSRAVASLLKDKGITL
jgi:hypothetical protein